MIVHDNTQQQVKYLLKEIAEARAKIKRAENELKVIGYWGLT